MSRRSSVGDLVPRDITEILAREAKANKAKKKHSRSISRALGWFRGNGKKKSDSVSSYRGQATESQEAKQHHSEQNFTKAAAKPEDDRKLAVHYQVSTHHQENVFIQSSRPRYLEDLHIEAQKGLKRLQQDENRDDLDCQDAQSINSSVSHPPGGNDEPRERKSSLESGSTAGDSVMTASKQSMLTRQGSTFKPLNPVRRPERSKKRGRRTTIMGIPQHVQKELGLERGTLFHQNMDGQLQLINGGEAPSDIVVIPTIDGEVPAANHEGARVHLQDLEVLQSSKEERLLKQHIREVYKDDLALSHQSGHHLSPTQRPKSLAVPGLTTMGFLQEPQGPVMSVSPQATYLSKIIPNAILPSAVDVIKISHCQRRNSVRTVSKNSLASGSPASSHSRAPHGHLSAGSNWSHSQSSETVVSNSSTISSKGSARNHRVPNGTIKETEHSMRPASDQVSLGSTTSWVSSASANTKPQSEMNSHATQETDEGECQRSDRSVVRSMSVIKTKMPPAPPTRTYSLHSEQLKPCFQEPLEAKDSEISGGKVSGVKGIKHSNTLDKALSPNLPGNAGSPTNSVDSSSLDDSRSSVISSIITSDQTVTLDSMPGSSESSPQKLPSQDNKFERTLSPSSGYSSQSGTPTLYAKEIYPPSPGQKKAKPAKPERTSTRTSPPASISSSLTSLSSAMSESVQQEASANGLPSNIPKGPHPVSFDSTKVTPTLETASLKEIFDIPPPPKVKAPCPPPPETWIHNKRTFELLCGSKVESRLSMLQKQQPKTLPSDKKQVIQNTVEVQQRQVEDLTSNMNEVTMESQKRPILGQNSELSVESIREPPAGKTKEGPVNQITEYVLKQELTETSKEQKNSEGELLKLHQANQKEEEDVAMIKEASLTVMKRNNLIACKNENLKVQGNLLDQKKVIPPEVNIHSPPAENILTTQKVDVKNQDHVVDLQSSMQTLPVEGHRQVGVSPPPSPPPAHQPPPPPSKKCPTVSAPCSSLEDNQEMPTMESSWPPPPPPPMEEHSVPILEEQDELDFPPPPPPVLQEPQAAEAENFPVAETEKMLGPTKKRVLEEEPPKEATPSPSTMAAEEECKTQAVIHNAEVTQGNQGPGDTLVLPVMMEVKTLCSEMSLEMKSSSAVNQHSENQSQIPQLPPVIEEPPPLPEGIPPPPQEAPPPLPAAVLQTGSPVFCHTPIPPTEKQATMSFKRPNTSIRDGKGKDQLSRNKSSPVPKEDANIPLVTPSLLQMVRLRSVNVSDDQTSIPAEGLKTTESKSSKQDQNQTPLYNHSVPQKPIRKSLSMKSPPPVLISSSMRLQEAFRMKTAATRPRESLPARPSLRSPLSSSSSEESGAPSPRSPEGGDIHRSPASTASFIFSRSTKKVIIETASSPEVQSSLKQSLAAELMQVTDSSSNLVAANPSTQMKKQSKVPPPVARKPGYVPNREKLVSHSVKMENSKAETPLSKANGHTSAGQQAQQKDGNA